MIHSQTTSVYTVTLTYYVYKNIKYHTHNYHHGPNPIVVQVLRGMNHSGHVWGGIKRVDLMALLRMLNWDWSELRIAHR